MGGLSWGWGGTLLGRWITRADAVMAGSSICMVGNEANG